MNRFRNYVLMAAGFAVLVLVVGVFSAGPAIAQAVRAALVSNVDDPGRIPYRVAQSFQGDCSFFQCAGRAVNVPAGKRLVITNVTGTVRSTVPAGSRLELEISAGNVGASVPLIYSGTFGINLSFVFNQQVLLVFDPGAGPSAQLFSGESALSFGQVIMSGYLLDCMAAPCATIAP